jgi:hypothetical protein
MKQKTVAEIVCAYCRIDGNCVNDVREENKTIRAVVREDNCPDDGLLFGWDKKDYILL